MRSVWCPSECSLLLHGLLFSDVTEQPSADSFKCSPNCAYYISLLIFSVTQIIKNGVISNKSS